MNLTKTLPALLPFAAIPLLAFTIRGDEVSFQPGEGVSATKELAFTTTFYLDDISVTMDGQELPAEMMGAAMDEGLLIDANIVVTDEYVSSREGRMLTLLRSFDELTLEAGPESQAEIVDEFAELEDSTVSFAWDSDADEYVKTFHESEGDEDLLENLDPDMDFIALLPDGEVDEGDSWEASGERLGAIFFPGGVPANPSTDDEDAEEMAELFREELEGQLSEAFEDFVINCTYTGSREDGDVTVGVIDFKFEGDTSLDLSDLIQEAIDLQAGEAGIEADISATMGFEFEGEGTLLWNLRAGHVHGFNMSGDITLSADVDGEIDAMGESHSMEMSAEVSGEASWEMTTSGGEEEE
jgi:hypothetical protein